MISQSENIEIIMYQEIILVRLLTTNIIVIYSNLLCPRIIEQELSSSIDPIIPMLVSESRKL